MGSKAILRSAQRAALALLLAALMTANAIAQPAQADQKAVADFYRGKTIDILVGFGPGGGYDLYSRIIARHMSSHLPGNPNIVVRNRPGAGSLVAANALYVTEPQDGTVFGTISEGLVLQQRLGDPSVRFDARKFNWLGAAVQTSYACAARSDLNVSAEDLLKGKPLVVAGTSPGSSPYDVPAVLNATLNLKLKIVSGYTDTPNLIMSINKKETDALCSTLSTLIEPAGRVMLEGDPPLGRIFMVLADRLAPSQAANPLAKGVQSAELLAASETARHLLQAFDAPAQMHKPFVAPPGVPAERVAALREALAQTFAHPEFKAEVEHSSLAASPISGEETEQIVRRLLETPPAIADSLKSILVQ